MAKSLSDLLLLFRDRFGRRTGIAFLVLVVSIGLVLGLFSERYKALLQAQEWRIHTLRVLESLREMEVVLRRDRGLPFCALTGDRAFIGRLPNDQEFLALHTRLIELTRDNPAQQAQLRALSELWSDWQHGYLAPLLVWCNQPASFLRPSAAMLRPIGEQGSALRARIRNSLDTMIGIEKQLLIKREAEAEQLKQISSRLLSLVALLASMLGLGFLVFVVHSASRMRHLNQDLREEIGQRHQASQEIARFQQVLDNTFDMIFMFDPVTLRITYANFGMVHCLGQTREYLLGLPAHRLHAGDMETAYRDWTNHLLGGETPLVRSEAVFTTAGSGEVPVELFIQHIPGERVGMFIGIARDITERQRIDRMKREFMSTVSHELRTPLTSIHGALALLAGGAVGQFDVDATRMIAIAHDNSQRLVLLINDILDMEKIETGNLRLDMRPVDPAALLRNALEANGQYAAKYGVTLSLNAEAAPAVMGDHERLMQVMANLVSNAIKFSPSGGTVDIVLSTLPGHVRVAVRDQGNGIPDEFRNRIFQKFSQADTSDTRQKGGTGLGLSICKSLIEQMDGRIGFESPAGGGTEFWFELPIPDAA